MPAKPKDDPQLDAQRAHAEQLRLHEETLKAAKRRRMLLEAKEDLIEFTRLTMPHPEDPDDIAKSRYLPVKHHRIIAAALQEVEKGNILRLIITMPPRAGKTELCSKKFVPWILGRDAYKHVIFATYNEEFARDIGKEVRETMRSKVFKQIFPGCNLRAGSQAADRVQTHEGGIASFVGRGGSITGRGGDCLLGSTLVTTSEGKIPISELNSCSLSIKLLSMQHDATNLVWKKIQAICHREADGFYRITTASGRVVEATAEHPFYCRGQWRKASSLNAGDSLVLAVQEAGSEDCVRAEQAREEGSERVLLQPQLRLQSFQREGGKGWEFLPNMRSKVSQSKRPILFEQVPAEKTAGAKKYHSVPPQNDCLPAVQCAVLESTSDEDFLRATVRQRSARASNDGQGQSGLEKWHVPASKAEAQRQGVSIGSPESLHSGRQSVRDMRRADGVGGSSHQLESIGQSSFEPGYDVLEMPHDPAWSRAFKTEEDFVALVEYVCEPTVVWNLQVEGTENFFANDVLVHNCLIADDLIKDREEADSASFRNKLWDWWNQVFLTRKMDAGARVVIIMTRWHEDDPIGRLTDPKNEYYRKEEAEKWKILALPAIAVEDDPMGREVGEPLWPERFPLEFLKNIKAADARGFSALYQGQPSPDDGDFFKRDWLKTYQPNELPTRLRKYVASDHAVSTAQTADLTCLLPVGVCEDNIIWVLPDVWWRKAKTDDVVEAMIAMMDRHKPLAWWAEKGHISKSIGPFLHKRMAEQGIYCAIEEVTPAKDKQTRAQSIQGRVSMGRVRFPAFMPWWSDASDELLKFPSARHDDFVDALSWIGLGLQRQIGANRIAPKPQLGARTGSIEWVKEMTKFEERNRQMLHADGF